MTKHLVQIMQCAMIVSDDQSRTMVVGCLPSHKSEDECKSLLLQHIHQQCNVTMIDVFSKVQFRNVLWNKFDSMSVRDRIVSTLSKSRLSFDSAAIWMSGDAPLPVRVEKNHFLTQASFAIVGLAEFCDSS